MYFEIPLNNQSIRHFMNLFFYFYRFKSIPECHHTLIYFYIKNIFFINKNYFTLNPKHSYQMIFFDALIIQQKAISRNIMQNFRKIILKNHRNTSFNLSPILIMKSVFST